MGHREPEQARQVMLLQQLVPRGITDQRVLGAMGRVPRERFVPEGLKAMAYEDCALPTMEGQTISQPFMVAVMTQLLGLTGTERVLKIGTGSGYQSAVLAELSESVYTVENVESLSRSASALLVELGYDNVHVQTGDGTLGWPEHAPYDRILVTAGAPEPPAPLIEQLAEGGVMVIPVGSQYRQDLLKLTKLKGELLEESHVPCVFVPLVGEHGWQRD